MRCPLYEGSHNSRHRRSSQLFRGWTEVKNSTHSTYISPYLRCYCLIVFGSRIYSPRVIRGQQPRLVLPIEEAKQFVEGSKLQDPSRHRRCMSPRSRLSFHEAVNQLDRTLATWNDRPLHGTRHTHPTSYYCLTMRQLSGTYHSLVGRYNILLNHHRTKKNLVLEILNLMTK
jgi:hypothetical protein